ncbi:peptidoglycan-associated lipoprotein Pal [Candidatus Nitrospira bockiana]
MYRRYPLFFVTGVLGFLLLSAAACSKSIQATSGSKSFEPGAKKETVASRPSPPSGATSPNAGSVGSPAPRSSEPSARMMDRPPDLEPSGLEPSGLESSPATPVPSLSTSEPPHAPMTSKGSDEQRVPGDMLVAKTEPADASRRRIEEMQREQIATAAAGLEDVFFGFDSWQITDEGKQTLMLDAEWLKANPGKMIMIEGHCDERGTLAYNLVLGEKRAKAVQKYLVELGVSPQQLTVVSYGKERPFCKERDEACYQKNRRGHLAVRAQ